MAHKICSKIPLILSNRIHKIELISSVKSSNQNWSRLIWKLNLRIWQVAPVYPVLSQLQVLGPTQRPGPHPEEQVAWVHESPIQPSQHRVSFLDTGTSFTEYTVTGL